MKSPKPPKVEDPAPPVPELNEASQEATRNTLKDERRRRGQAYTQNTLMGGNSTTG